MAIRVGGTPKAGRSSKFFSLKADVTYQVVLLAETDQIVSIDQCALWDFAPAPMWAHIGVGDPADDLGIKPAYRAFIPMMIEGEVDRRGGVTKTDNSGEVVLLSMPRTMHTEFCNISDMTGSLFGRQVRIKKTGSGLGTRYTVLPTGTVKSGGDLPETIPTVEDVIASLGPQTREEIIKLIEQRSQKTWSDVVDIYQEKAEADKALASSKKKGGAKDGEVELL